MSQIDQPPTPEVLVRELDDLPPTPRVLQSLQRLMADPDAMLVDMGDLVALEPGLSARVVRIANSAVFRRGTKVDNILEAIQRVGLTGIHELVTFAVGSQLVGRPLTSYKLDAQTLWARAVTCALAAASLGEKKDVDRVSAYSAGLMHGLGLVVIDRYAVRQKPARLLPTSGYPFDSAVGERAWLGYSHAEAGAALLELWGFSADVVDAVRYQLEPENAPDHSRDLCMTVAVARWARSQICIPSDLIPDQPPEAWLRTVGISAADLPEWVKSLKQQCQLACSELKLG
ncbi:MAG TPA: HDOD domain-containing protein [Opitutaceae bacterium]|nr:HDOD domain-containing protein [Opitutaceae bacterium]